MQGQLNDASILTQFAVSNLIHHIREEEEIR